MEAEVGGTKSGRCSETDVRKGGERQGDRRAEVEAGLREAGSGGRGETEDEDAQRFLRVLGEAGTVGKFRAHLTI